jgi:outer membrane protein OmpA-like peptidoglycan-associated protein
MKKLFLMLAAGMMAASVNAQNTAITANKFTDNIYVGVKAGAATPMQKWGDYGFMKGFAPNIGVRVGKNLTTVFGLAIDADAYIMSKSDSKSIMGNKTFINATNVSLLGTFNLSNLFKGYTGEPRNFEVIGLYGFGWEHTFGGLSKANGLTSKAALDFAFNLGAEKAWQLYIEPAVVFGMVNLSNGMNNALALNNPNYKYDSRNGLFQLNVGLNYKFGNSNGTHNFVKAALRDQAEVDALNAKINELRADNSKKDGKIAEDGRTISDLQAQLQALQNQPKQTAAVQVVEKKNVNLQPIVIFGQGKSTLDNAGYASCEMVAKYMRNHPESKVLVKGYASPEGKAELNQKLSEARAAAVKNALVKRYKINAARITTQGLGATSEISEENDFNRVAMFFDVTK